MRDCCRSCLLWYIALPSLSCRFKVYNDLWLNVSASTASITQTSCMQIATQARGCLNGRPSWWNPTFLFCVARFKPFKQMSVSLKWTDAAGDLMSSQWEKAFCVAQPNDAAMAVRWILFPRFSKDKHPLTFAESTQVNDDFASQAFFVQLFRV